MVDLDLDAIEAAYDDFTEFAEPTPSEMPDAPYNADVWTLRSQLNEASSSGKALVAEVRRLRKALDDVHDWCDPRDYPTNKVARDVVEEVRYRAGVALGRRSGISVGTSEDEQLRAEAKRFLARGAVVEHFIAEQVEFRRAGNGEARRHLAERLARVDAQLGVNRV